MMPFSPNLHGKYVGKLHGQHFVDWYVNQCGEKWVFERVAAIDKEGRVDLSLLASDECLHAPGVIYKFAGVVTAALPIEKQAGHCSCGRKVMKVLNSRLGRVAFVYPDIQGNRHQIFRCQSCLKPIASHWQPDEV